MFPHKKTGNVPQKRIFLHRLTIYNTSTIVSACIVPTTVDALYNMITPADVRDTLLGKMPLLLSTRTSKEKDY